MNFLGIGMGLGIGSGLGKSLGDVLFPPRTPPDPKAQDPLNPCFHFDGTLLTNEEWHEKFVAAKALAQQQANRREAEASLPPRDMTIPNIGAAIVFLMLVIPVIWMWLFG